MNIPSREDLLNLCGEARFPEAATAALLSAHDALLSDGFRAQTETACARFFEGEAANLKELPAALAACAGASAETSAMTAILWATVALREQYRRRGIPDAIFLGGMPDYRAKLRECLEMRGVWGTITPGWFEGFLNLRRFGLGRFQFAMETLAEPYVLPDGKALPVGHESYACHIPSEGGPLTDDVRMASYRAAYAFFRPRQQDSLLVVTCGSWLLYPEHARFLPKTSNLLRFAGDFDMLRQADTPEFKDGWRLFGKAWGGPLDALPEDTGLRRAYKKRLLNGQPAGRGYGILVFDGEKIINRREGTRI